MSLPPPLPFEARAEQLVRLVNARGENLIGHRVSEGLLPASFLPHPPPPTVPPCFPSQPDVDMLLPLICHSQSQETSTLGPGPVTGNLYLHVLERPLLSIQTRQRKVLHHHLPGSGTTVAANCSVECFKLNKLEMKDNLAAIEVK